VTPRAWSTPTPAIVPEAVRSRIKLAWGATWPRFVLPFQSNSETSQIVGSVKGRDFSGIAVVDARTGRIVTRVDAFEEPDIDQAFGSADAAHAVWKEYVTRDLSQFVIKAWDRKTARVSQIGASRMAGDGESYPAPLEAPVIVGNVAAWVEGAGPDQLSELVVADLATGRRHVVRRGHVGWVSAAGSSIVWAESYQRGAQTTLRAVDATTLKPAELPPSLEDVHGAGYLASDGEASAWIDTDTDPTSGSAVFSLVVSPTPTTPGRTIVTRRVGGFSPPVLVTSTAVVAQLSQGGVVVVDRRTGRYCELKGVYGANQAGPSIVLSGEADRYPNGAVAVLSPADVASMEDE
jgi:hypothetical protein